ncbi:YxiG-like protein [Streptomyces sp. NBC_00683]|uniref:YxiG-like protein n=1 Tax=Streptomyces sp. NBC_00683 TaxID=2903670 RepID=UPI003FA7EE39
MLDETFDHAVVHHGYTNYMHDYEVLVCATADPRTGITPSYLRSHMSAQVPLAPKPATASRKARSACVAGSV